jgi:glyoxylase-like metal-dependent hydrolase (beta-lactamase superfamily II)
MPNGLRSAARGSPFLYRSVKFSRSPLLSSAITPQKGRLVTPPQIARIISFPFDENTYIVSLEGRQDAIVVDPGLEPHKIIAHLQQHSLVPAAIVCTHGHSDHIAGNAALKERWPDCPVVIGTGDAPKLTDPVQNLSALFGFEIVSPPADVLLSEGDIYEAAGLRLQVLDTPGHCAGHVAYVVEGTSPLRVFGGDVLMRLSVGRSDFPDSDPRALEHSIRKKLYILPDDSVVYPGHGPETTIGFERLNNPFVPGD